MSSFVKNCFIMCRDTDEGVLFDFRTQGVTVRLDRYAIIPMEQYDRLLLISEEWAAMKLREIAKN